MKKTILVVEDNPQLLASLVILLRCSEFKTITAKNGREALMMLESVKPPDLIVCDISMPEMDGYEFFHIVSNSPRWKDIPFMFLTVRTSHEDILLGKSLGVSSYITKPFTIEKLLDSIEALIHCAV
jgi:CheY-like chemotaxis protein